MIYISSCSHNHNFNHIKLKDVCLQIALQTPGRSENYVQS